jgi:hypothetical protein
MTCCISSSTNSLSMNLMVLGPKRAAGLPGAKYLPQSKATMSSAYRFALVPTV